MGHIAGDKVVQAYQRSDLLEQRRAVMEAWADYLHGRTAAILPMKRGARR